MKSSEAIRMETEIPDSIEASVKARFDQITQNLKAKPHEPITTAQQEKIDELIRLATPPKRHMGRHSFQGGAWSVAMGQARSKVGSGCLIALIGQRGTGKTQMAVGLIQDACRRLETAKFTSAMEIFLDLKESYRPNSNTSERVVVERYCKPRFLVIDEIQERAETEWEDRILTHLINRRYNDEKDTVLIGNLTATEFQKSMGLSVVRRLNETGGLIECNWPSYKQ
jgi:DNA replication protein DnaC